MNFAQLTKHGIKTTVRLWDVGLIDWRKENGQYIPMPATYLNQRRWEDEPDIKKEPAKKQIELISAEEHAALMAEIKLNAASPRDIDNLIIDVSKRIKG